MTITTTRPAFIIFPSYIIYYVYCFMYLRYPNLLIPVRNGDRTLSTADRAKLFKNVDVETSGDPFGVYSISTSANRYTYSRARAQARMDRASYRVKLGGPRNTV